MRLFQGHGIHDKSLQEMLRKTREYTTERQATQHTSLPDLEQSTILPSSDGIQTRNTLILGNALSY